MTKKQKMEDLFKRVAKLELEVLGSDSGPDRYEWKSMLGRVTRLELANIECPCCGATLMVEESFDYSFVDYTISMYCKCGFRTQRHSNAATLKQSIPYKVKPKEECDDCGQG